MNHATPFAGPRRMAARRAEAVQGADAPVLQAGITEKRMINELRPL
jgi:hypothetical protein